MNLLTKKIHQWNVKQLDGLYRVTHTCDVYFRAFDIVIGKVLFALFGVAFYTALCGATVYGHYQAFVEWEIPYLLMVVPADLILLDMFLRPHYQTLKEMFFHGNFKRRT